MTTARTAGVSMRDAFRYTPGDGYVYVWSKDYSKIHVLKVTYDSEGVRQEVRTGDTVPLPVTRTATALVAAVDAWKRGRVSAA